MGFLPWRKDQKFPTFGSRGATHHRGADVPGWRCRRRRRTELASPPRCPFSAPSTDSLCGGSPRGDRSERPSPAARARRSPTAARPPRAAPPLSRARPAGVDWGRAGAAMLKQPQPLPPQPPPGGPVPQAGPPPARKAPPPGAAPSPNGSLSPSGGAGRAATAAPSGGGGGGGTRGQSTGKGPPQSPVFEGVYNNSRMLHFLTAVVGSTCDVKVKNGSTFEGIFKTLSSKFELAVDAVHRKTPDQLVGPKREDIVDTMVFKPTDVMLVHFRNVDFNYATKDKFTDSAIAMNSKVNGEHKEKVLQRWEGGDSNSDDYDLESDMSNGWDPNEMFKFNEENYGVKTTYDSSLSSYTVPLEKDNSEEFRQREARAAQLAREIESSPQYRLRIAMENDDGRTEEEKHSSVQRQVSGRDSPSLASREGKYVPLPQRVREGSRGGIRCSSSRGGRPGVGSMPPRGSAHHPDSNSSPAPEQRGINGGPSRMSPKSQRPIRGAKTMSSPSSRPVEVSVAPPAVGRMYPPRSPKSASATPASSQDSPVGSAVSAAPASPLEARTGLESSVSPNPPSPKVAAPVPVTAVEGKEAPTSVAKDPGRTLEATGSCELSKAANKGLQNEQKRTQLEELRKFGAQFKLQPSSSPETSLESFSARPKEPLEGKEKSLEPGICEGPEEAPPVSMVPKPNGTSLELLPESGKEEKGLCEVAEQQATNPPGKGEPEDKEEGPVSEQVKKSTLNPNAKEFNPSKTLLSVNKSTSTPTSPGPRAHSTPSIPVITAGQTGMYSPQYISYIPQIHMSPAVQAPQMYPYPVSSSVPGQQGKYRGAKGSLPPQRSDQHQPTSAPPIMQAAAAAGPPLVAATPYSSYISYNPQQFTGQPTMMQPMAHYPSQPVFAPMLQSNPRMMTSGSHPQAIVSSSTPQYPPSEQPTPQTLYATVHQSYPHHATQLHPHQPQPATTPTGNQQQAQHAAPSPVQHQAGQPPHLASAQQQQNLYHTATLTATPPSITPGPSAQSPQSSFPQQAVYAIHAHQQLQHSYTNMAHVTQAHVQTGITAAPPPHPGAPHPPQVMLLHPTQTHGGPPPRWRATERGAHSLSLHTISIHLYRTPSSLTHPSSSHSTPLEIEASIPDCELNSQRRPLPGIRFAPSAPLRVPWPGSLPLTVPQQGAGLYQAPFLLACEARSSKSHLPLAPGAAKVLFSIIYNSNRAVK
ncbi:ataxin-2-like protein isoform X2 [Gopherus flavomarginatus]|uniref:ataxin-2-like protein isoform X2 n=1 Tax=Gopherus flavomarginatus TaxID=286002 RepID=UPI0021CB9E55|nr:ataxin-2-like protein isoform X2 [Gopherus flavomarginatus]